MVIVIDFLDNWFDLAVEAFDNAEMPMQYYNQMPHPYKKTLYFTFKADGKEAYTYHFVSSMLIHLVPNYAAKTVLEEIKIHIRRLAENRVPYFKMTAIKAHLVPVDYFDEDET